MQLFSRLMLDRPRIVRQPLYVSLKPFVLFFQHLQLLLQRPRIVPLLLVRRQPVLPENDMKSQRHREHTRRDRRRPAPQSIRTREQAPHAAAFRLHSCASLHCFQSHNPA